MTTHLSKWLDAFKILQQLFLDDSPRISRKNSSHLSCEIIYNGHSKPVLELTQIDSGTYVGLTSETGGTSRELFGYKLIAVSTLGNLLYSNTSFYVCQVYFKKMHRFKTFRQVAENIPIYYDNVTWEQGSLTRSSDSITSSSITCSFITSSSSLQLDQSYLTTERTGKWNLQKFVLILKYISSTSQKWFLQFIQINEMIIKIKCPLKTIQFLRKWTSTTNTIYRTTIKIDGVFYGLPKKA